MASGSDEAGARSYGVKRFLYDTAMLVFAAIGAACALAGLGVWGLDRTLPEKGDARDAFRTAVSAGGNALLPGGLHVSERELEGVSTNKSFSLRLRETVLLGQTNHSLTAVKVSGSLEGGSAGGIANGLVLRLDGVEKVMAIGGVLLLVDTGMSVLFHRADEEQGVFHFRLLEEAG